MREDYKYSDLTELQNAELDVESQKQIEVNYQNKVVGKYYADIIVNNLVILELKAAESIVEEHEFQLINYLKANDIEVGLLLNLVKNLKFEGKYF